MDVPSMKSKQYLKELTATLVVYGVLLIGSIELLTHVDVARPWRDVIALSPMLPAAAMAWVILRELRRMDELQRRIQLEALGFSFAGTAVLTFSYGFLEGLGYPKLSMFTVWPILATLWVVGLVLARRRYQ
jgi:hypothetical protein